MYTGPPVQGQQPLPSGPHMRVPSQATGIDVTAFVLAFLLPLIGMILGIVAISQAHKQGRQASGLAIAGVVIGALGSIVWLIVIIVAASSSDTNSYLTCVNNAYANGTDPNLCPGFYTGN
jgi:uncharacterized protein YggT (Ycf19 family)